MNINEVVNAIKKNLVCVKITCYVSKNPTDAVIIDVTDFDANRRITIEFRKDMGFGLTHFPSDNLEPDETHMDADVLINRVVELFT